jgi:hypothetical protein
MSELTIVKHDVSGMLKRLDEDGGPSFLAVVAMSGVVLIFVFLGALLLVGLEGRGMMPNTNKPDLEPTSMLVMPTAHRLPSINSIPG